ncbi:conjugative transposon protein TraJ [Dyadobacter frigoris]|uniref:Conjugative transposon protein TraJ n=1 Tax=Dyadobacter frigoris TaxID=2576211 RepID=A0A4U6D4A3_9BACT|nr:conjugative transposon protein TraJ [Dyadobacter frigoris]TKT91001.1 conjugative transposon protein TraJ [Dyadobacter frigoris]GLU56193.1 conjugative transposon protein TraJ [Dyadobacter frigoris]
MNKLLKVTFYVFIAILLPNWANAQGFEQQIRGLNGVLDELYSEMLPMCSELINVGRGIAGFAAIWYIAHRVWRHLANAEPIDFYPLFRPFVLGFAILIFPSVIAMINAVLSPTVRGTAGLVKDSDKAIALLLKKKEDAIKSSDFWQMYVGDDQKGSREKWLKYTYGDGYSEGFTDGIANDIKFYMSKQSYNFRNSIKAGLSEILRVVFESASLCVNTIRTFYLIVMAIIGPIAFGIAVFDGFQHTLTAWIARYINIFLWLPVANIFGAIIGKIQEKMISLDIRQVQQNGDTFFSAHDMAYLVFLIIGIVGYFSVPSVAGYIIQAGGGNALLHKTTALLGNAATGVGNYAFPAGGGFGRLPAAKKS